MDRSALRIRLSLPLDGYRVRASVTVPQGPTRARNLLPVLWEFSDAVTRAAVEREERLGRSVPCRKGCSACCRLYLGISPAEAYRLHELVEELPASQRDRIRARFAAVRERLVEAGLWEEVSHPERLDPQATARLAAEYFRRQIDCPFLEEGACSIYASRPLACREYLVTSPAAECSRPLEGKVRGVRLPWTTWKAQRMMQRDFGEEPPVPLVALPEWIAAYPEPPAVASGAELILKAFSGVSITEEGPAPSAGECPPRARTSARVGDRDRPGRETRAQRGSIVPDYAPPDALLVPHYGLAERALLEEIASAASASVGVILLTPDPVRTREFVARQVAPDRFAVVVAASNTAWIRDRAPIVVRDPDAGTRWYLPRMPEDGRPDDASLFESICARPTAPAPFVLARGNLVAGPEGRAVSTTAVLRENGLANLEALTEGGRELGIRRWILFPPFQNEMTRHADVHLRFLRDDLVAIGWNLSEAQDRAIAEELEAQLCEALPALRSLRIPVRSQGSRYASPLNWIQLGRELLVPRYTLTPEADLARTRQLLEAEGFRPRFLASPTLDYGGSLHCLSASIYL